MFTITSDSLFVLPVLIHPHCRAELPLQTKSYLNMLLYTFVLLVLAAVGLADMVLSSSAAMDTGNCTLTYIATQPPQIGPTTTIWKAIMTTFLYVSAFHHHQSHT